MSNFPAQSQVKSKKKVFTFSDCPLYVYHLYTITKVLCFCLRGGGEVRGPRGSPPGYAPGDCSVLLTKIILHYTRGITPKRESSGKARLRGLVPIGNLNPKKYRSGGKSRRRHDVTDLNFRELTSPESLAITGSNSQLIAICRLHVLYHSPKTSLLKIWGLCFLHAFTTTGCTYTYMHLLLSLHARYLRYIINRLQFWMIDKVVVEKSYS